MDTELIKFLAAERQLINLVMALNAVVIITVVINLGMLLKRVFGAARNGSEPYDLVTNKTLKATDEAAAKRTEGAVKSITDAIDVRFESTMKEYEKQHRKMNVLLIIMRDLRAYMIYHRMPATEELPPIEEEV